MKADRVRRTLILLLLFIVVAMIAPEFAPYETVTGIDITTVTNQPPSLAHPLGTNDRDIDLLSLILEGSRVSLVIATVATFMALVIGTVYGLVAAFAGGMLDALLMRTTDVAFSVPRFLVLLATASIVSEPLTTMELTVLIGVTGWFDVARITRGEVAALRTRDWALAARASGASGLRLAFRHIFPHLVPILTVLATLGIGHTVMLEAGLMFLGVASPGATLGRLLQEGTGLTGLSHWWLTVFPGMAIVGIVLACNALGNALRDVFAPEQVHARPAT
ncbi:MAG: ABC transporter permease [Gemmatimonas sp.]